MQRFILFLLLILLLPSMSLKALPDYQEQTGLDTIVSKRAKLRDGPGTDWYILGYIEAGTMMRLDGRAPYENIWVRGITSDGRIGWVFGELLAASPEQLTALPTIWVDTPFTLPAPSQPPAAMPETAISNASLPAYDVISGITRNARTIFRRGQRLGNRPNVFSKVGDSITNSRYFLFPFGWGTYNLRDYSYLQPVVDYFSTETARDSNNSFANPSLAAYDGLTTERLLDPGIAWTEVCQPGETPLECEYRIVKPSIALILIGTNDISLVPIENYRTNLERIVQISADRGVIPVLSLLPMRDGHAESVQAYNQVIADIASAYNVPLWNYPGALQGFNLDYYGLSDGTHPSFPPGSGPNDYAAAADFTPENLRYGYTVRNLTALQVLDAIWRQVIG